MSHPSGVRELKHSYLMIKLVRIMLSHPSGVRELKLPLIPDDTGSGKSHPSGVRELKLMDIYSKVVTGHVAPFRGA